MAELEQELRGLAAWIEFPPTPDLTGAVRGRLPARARRRRRGLAIAIALAAVAVGVAFAVPPARTAILRFFHLGAVHVERVGTLPPARERPLATGLGPPLSLAQAERRSGLRLQLPASGTRPRHAYAHDGLLAVVLRAPGGAPVLLAEVRASSFGFVKKIAGGATTIEGVDVDGRPGLWISGAAHVVLYEDRFGRVRSQTLRIAGNVLAWQRGELTLRLEGPLSKREALVLARSIR